MKEIQFLMYDKDEKIEVLVQDEMIWATQKALSKLFDADKSSISRHLKNIFASGELQENASVAKIATVVKNGAVGEIAKEINYYNLDAIITVGYRINSQKATKFRIWATDVLKEYIVKGFKIDVERMKHGEQVFGKDYFRELIETVRSIRASERRIWQQISDVFAEISYDYDKNSDVTQKFYATVQNKFHYAITGNTAAEIIYIKANRENENMGLTIWKHSPKGRILKSYVVVEKTYLEEKEIQQLERTVTGYFDYIEGLIERENTFTMESLAESVNKFLNFNEYKVLEGSGKVAKIVADKKAVSEYDEFNKTQKIISDFDIQVKKLGKKI